MRKFIIIFVSVLALLAFFLFCLFFIFDENDITEKFKKTSLESSFVFDSNNIFITEEEVEMYGREVARDRAEENLSPEEIREAAIERAIKRAVADNYFEKKGITVSEEEIDETLSLHILEEEGVETKEEYFDLMARRGFSKAEVERDLIVNIKIKKALSLIAQDIEVTKEEAREYYLQRKEELEKEGVSLRPFEEIEDTAKEDVKMIFALEKLLEDFDKERENAQIEILE